MGSIKATNLVLSFDYTNGALYAPSSVRVNTNSEITHGVVLIKKKKARIFCASCIEHVHTRRCQFWVNCVIDDCIVLYRRIAGVRRTTRTSLGFRKKTYVHVNWFSFLIVFLST
jgi:hypothetical protein